MRKKTDVYMSCGTCPHTGKQRFPDRSSAKRMVRRIDKTLRVYRCDHGCGSWHLGHQFGMSREAHRAMHRRD